MSICAYGQNTLGRLFHVEHYWLVRVGYVIASGTSSL